jgi:hypothetical protein
MITTLPPTAPLQAKSRVKPMAIRLRGATPDEICNQQKKKHYDFGVNANSTNHTNDFAVI